MNTVLEKVRFALLPRVVTDDFDGQITDLINACLSDLRMAGISVDPLIVVTTQSTVYDDSLLEAVQTYCKMNFGDVSAEKYDRLKASYDEQKAQMQKATGYTIWV